MVTGAGLISKQSIAGMGVLSMLDFFGDNAHNQPGQSLASSHPRNHKKIMD